MEELQVTARFRIDQADIAQFKSLAEQCIRRVRDKDTGTLQYDGFFSDDETVCEVRETYASSAAVLEHIDHLGDLLGPLFALAPPQISVYGSPSQELRDATADMAPTVYGFFHGL